MMGPGRIRSWCRICAAAAAVTSLPGAPSGAETLIVRSGEHDGFSRLVVAPSRRADWTLARQGGGYSLVLTGDNISYDASRVFDLIPRTRISDVSRGDGPGALFIRLACPCHATAFETTGGAVVIDVTDGPPPADSPFEATGSTDAVPAAAGLSPTVRLQFPPVSVTVPERDLALYWRPHDLPEHSVPAPDANPQAIDDRVRDQTGDPATKDTPSASTAGDTSPEATAPATGSDVARATEAELLMELSRAAGQGLVEVDAAAEADKALAAATQPVTQPAADDGGAPDGPSPPDQDPTPEPPADERLSVRAETSVDRDLLELGRRIAVTQDGDACASAEAVDISTWGDDRPPSIQIADARGRLVGEFDAVDSDAVNKLAKLYLHFGFGAEARAVLDAFPGGADAAAHDTLRALSFAVDGEAGAELDALAHQSECDAPVALWAVLARPTIAPGTAVNQRAVVRAFSALPIHLRRSIGPALAGRFLTAGQPDVARAIEDAIARAPGPHGDGLTMIGAGIAFASGYSDAGEAALSKMDRANSEFMPEAILMAINARISEGRRVDRDMAEIAAALALEHRDGPFALDYARAAVLGLAAAGAVEEALATLDGLPGQNSEGRDGALVDLVRLLARDAEDEVLLPVYFDRRADLLAATPDFATTLDLADRLGAAGLAGEVETLLAGEAGLTERGRLIRARSALAAGKQGAIAGILDGMDGSEAALLRAEAASLSGDFAAATAAFAEAGDAESAARAAWLAGQSPEPPPEVVPTIADAYRKLSGPDAPALAPSSSPDAGGNPPQAGATGAMATTGGSGATATETAGPLSHGRALLKTSADLREAIRAMLSQP